MRATTDPSSSAIGRFFGPSIVLVAAALGLAGCATDDAVSGPGTDAAAAESERIAMPAREPAVRVEAARAVSRPIVLADGPDAGRAIRFEELVDRAARADVVLLGETHDDAVGHAVQREFVRALLDRAPGRVAVAMEMLERDEQPLVDDYLEGIIDAEAFATRTFSTTWAGPGSWEAWYQPVIDLARDAGAPVIAANAPRRYVRLANREGLERVAGLDPARRAFVEVPLALDAGAYRRRFWEVMAGHGTDGTGHAPAELPPLDDPTLTSIFQSQMTWDATMADSVRRAHQPPIETVVLLVGQFHADFDGGTVIELERRAPGLDVLIVSLQAAESSSLRDEDRGRADVVVYTGG